MKTKRHVHSTFIDRIGPPILGEHFGLTAQRLHMWRVRGIPKGFQIEAAKLALDHGVMPPPEFLAPIFRIAEAIEGPASEKAA